MKGFAPDRRRFLGATALAGMTLAFGSAGHATRSTGRIKKPNIIFILADDMGYADLSCYGAQGYRTPVLDGLAEQGVRLNQAYANAPICSPTRTALVTGRYQGRYRAGLAEPNIRFSPGDELPAGTPTVASLLRAEGYRTAFVGKWHVCEVPRYDPTHYGYDSFYGMAGGAADYFSHTARPAKFGNGQGMYENGKAIERDGYLTDILADEAIRQIQAGGDKPLFLSLHFNAPHWPWEGPEDGARAASLEKLDDRTGGSLETYAKMMMSMDANIGRVLEALDAAGMTEDTIVVFTSDNGGERYSNSWPFVGYKGELLEGGIRVPFIMRWPKRIRAGSMSEQVLVSMDTVPTFLAAAGGKAPAGMDGIDLLPQLAGEAPAVNRTLYWRMNAYEQAAVRDGDWKYLRIGGQEHLYNVRRDPRERAEQKDLQPEIFNRLKRQWEGWNATMLPYPADAPSERAGQNYSDRYNAVGVVKEAPR